VISFVDPDRYDVEGDRVISSFCHHILFFESPEAWRSWEEDGAHGAFALTVNEAWRLGRLANRLTCGEALEG